MFHQSKSKIMPKTKPNRGQMLPTIRPHIEKQKRIHLRAAQVELLRVRNMKNAILEHMSKDIDKVLEIWFKEHQSRFQPIQMWEQSYNIEIAKGLVIECLNLKAA